MTGWITVVRCERAAPIRSSLFKKGFEDRLIQKSGNGRLLLKAGRRVWWPKPPFQATWEVCEANEGHVFYNEDDALQASKKLSHAKDDAKN